jgi:hypothetical protein
MFPKRDSYLVEAAKADGNCADWPEEVRDIIMGCGA